MLSMCCEICPVLSLVQSVAPTNKTVLIVGEKGSRKQAIAKMIHDNSKRRYGRFIIIDLQSRMKNSVEIELFGREHVTFISSMAQMIGKIEEANNGTIFFNEIGEMPIELQPRLLRLIQDKEIYRVGGTSNINVDVRIIASTSRNLENDVKLGKFRPDLFYRIDAFRILVPPLRKCRDDIPYLANFMLKIAAENEGKPIEGFSEEALGILMNYNWPGNMEELESVIETAVSIEETDILQPSSLMLTFCYNENIEREKDNNGILPLEEIEKQAIIHALKVTGNNIRKTAKALGINRATVYKKLEKYNLITEISNNLPEA